MRPDLTFRSLWRQYRQDKFAKELATDWAAALLYRAPGFWLVALLAPTGISPTAVTLAAVPVVLAMPLAALTLPLAAAAIAVALLAALFQTLDCTDGALARATGRSSARGGALDFVIDMGQWGFFYTSIGLLADRVAAGDTVAGFFWTALAAVAAWLRLYARVIRDARPAAPAGPAAPGPARLGGFDRRERGISGLSGALPVLLILAFFTGTLPALVVFLLAYSLLDVGDAALATFRGWPRDSGDTGEESGGA